MIVWDEEVRDGVSYSGVDQSENAINYRGGTLLSTCTLVKQGVLRDSLPEGNFDVIMIKEVFEHLAS